MSKVSVKFLQAAHVGGEDRKRGSVHEVSEVMSKDPHFHNLVKAGLVVEAAATQTLAAESMHERQIRLAEKVLKQASDSAKKRAEASEGKAGEVFVKSPDDSGAAVDPSSKSAEGQASSEGKDEESKPEEKAAEAGPSDEQAEAEQAEAEEKEAPKKQKHRK